MGELQVVAIAVFSALGFAFYVFFVPFVGTKPFQIVAMAIYTPLVYAGEWDEVEKYLSGFTKVDDNRYSMKIFFEITKKKYLEALHRHDRAKAVDILVNDLKVFLTFNEEFYKEITQLLTLENFSVAAAVEPKLWCLLKADMAAVFCELVAQGEALQVYPYMPSLFEMKPN
ncbi:Protein TPR1 [Zea mays]|uniref:Protein TPR1 n=1 Tax=Zea mays TaxID=4577 RepID=A0A3L6D6Y7_MAIZE|nr:Protein TPR1 [Zea mays]